MLEFREVDPVNLLFYGDQEEKVPINGIYNHGFYDGNVKINALLLGLQGREHYAEILERMLKGFFEYVNEKTGLEIEFNIVDKKISS